MNLKNLEKEIFPGWKKIVLLGKIFFQVGKKIVLLGKIFFLVGKIIFSIFTHKKTGKVKKWYFVTIIVLTYCEKKLF